MHIVRILAKALAFNVGNLGHVAAVAGGGLHDDIERRYLGIVGDESTNTESSLCFALEVAANLSSSVEIEAVAEEQSLGHGIDSERLVMFNHKLAPLVRIAGVVTHTGEQSGEGKLEVLKEALGGDGIRKGGSVQYAVLLNPRIKCVPVGLSGIMSVIALSYAHNPLVSHGAHGGNAVFFGQEYV